MDTHMDPKVTAAIIASIVSLIVAIISLISSKKNQRRIELDKIRNREFQIRLNALQQSIHTIQRIKNELRYLSRKDDISKADIERSIELISNITLLHDESYADHLASIYKFESKLLHDLIDEFRQTKSRLGELAPPSHSQEQIQKEIRLILNGKFWSV